MKIQKIIILICPIISVRLFFFKKINDSNRRKFKRNSNTKCYSGFEIPAYQTEYSITGGVLPYSTTKKPISVNEVDANWINGIKIMKGINPYKN